jgi:urease accessory protein
VVKECCVYVPLVADQKVMMSVMNTHHIEGITYSFKSGNEVIPYLSPHEVRMLFSRL